jgi:hypothetical protein
VSVWDWRAGRRLGSLRAHQEEVTALALLPAEGLLLSGCRGGRVVAWRLGQAGAAERVAEGRVAQGRVAALALAGASLYVGDFSSSVKVRARGGAAPLPRARPPPPPPPGAPPRARQALRAPPCRWWTCLGCWAAAASRAGGWRSSGRRGGWPTRTSSPATSARWPAWPPPRACCSAAACLGWRPRRRSCGRRPRTLSSRSAASTCAPLPAAGHALLPHARRCRPAAAQPACACPTARLPACVRCAAPAQCRPGSAA